MENIANNLQALQNRILTCEQAYGRHPGSVKILAVSKTRTVEEILRASESGQMHFGENYLQEAEQKMAQLPNPALIWHYIGPIQSNKTRDIAADFSWVHSIDRIKIAQRLNDARPANLPPLNICIQLNISSESTKSGINPDSLVDFVNKLSEMPRLKLRGLMAMPKPEFDFNRQRQPFRQMRCYFDQLNDTGHDLDTLSMGTTNDMEAAIAEGATIVRIGTAIFGPRSVKR